MTNDRDWIGRPKSQDELIPNDQAMGAPTQRPYKVMSPFAGGVILGVAFGVAAGAVLAILGVVILRLLAS